MIVLRKRSNAYGDLRNYRVFGSYGQGNWMSIVEAIINALEGLMTVAETVAELAVKVQDVIRVKNQYEDAKEQAMDEGQSEEQAKQTAKMTLLGQAQSGQLLPVEEKTPTWVYAAGAVVALGLVGGGVYYFTRKKR